MHKPRFSSPRSTSIAVLGALALAAGCVTGDDETTAEPVGMARIALSAVPADVGCIRIRAAGVRTVGRDFDVAAEQAQLLSLDRLPTGEVTFSAAAFGGACASVAAGAEPGWVSNPVAATVPRNNVVTVALTMRRNGRASVDITFEDDVTPMPQPQPDAGAPPQPDAGTTPQPEPDAGATPAPVCELGRVRCTGPVLESCASESAGWQAARTCASDETCDIGTVGCLCQAGAVRCTGGTLMTCGGGTWMSRSCGSAALCDAPNARCLVCTPGAKRCFTSGTFLPVPSAQTCAADGLSWNTTATCFFGCTNGTCATAGFGT